MKKEKGQEEFNQFMLPNEFEKHIVASYFKNIIAFYFPILYLVLNGIFGRRIGDLIVGLCPIIAQIFWFFFMRKRNDQVKQYVSEKLDELEKIGGDVGQKISDVLKTIICHNQKMNK